MITFAPKPSCLVINMNPNIIIRLHTKEHLAFCNFTCFNKIFNYFTL